MKLKMKISLIILTFVLLLSCEDNRLNKNTFATRKATSEK